MKRSSGNFLTYKEACRKVIERADERCEVMIGGKRCAKFIPFDQARAINFLHTETRNGKSDAWICNPDHIIYGCDCHHIEEERTGKRVERCEYEEVYYIPE